MRKKINNNNKRNNTERLDTKRAPRRREESDFYRGKSYLEATCNCRHSYINIIYVYGKLYEIPTGRFVRGSTSNFRSLLSRNDIRYDTVGITRRRRKCGATGTLFFPDVRPTAGRPGEDGQTLARRFDSRRRCCRLLKLLLTRDLHGAESVSRKNRPDRRMRETRHGQRDFVETRFFAPVAATAPAINTTREKHDSWTREINARSERNGTRGRDVMNRSHETKKTVRGHCGGK